MRLFCCHWALKEKEKKPKVYGGPSMPKSKLHKLLNKLIQN